MKGNVPMVVKSVAERVTAGSRFGRLTVLRLHGKTKKRRHVWHHACLCDCGKEVLVTTRDLLLGIRVSCRPNGKCSAWHQDVKIVGSEVWAAQKLAVLRNIAKKHGYAAPVCSVDLILDLWNLSGGRCECCGQQSEASLHLDHCHETGRVRGFICRSCNFAIGLAKDKSSRLFLMACWVSSRSD